MSDQNPPSLGDIANAAKAAKEVLPETIKETDSVISTMVGWFNNVVLYPIKCANITYQYKLESFKEDFAERAKRIPLECVQEPKLLIAGPTLEALKYTIDEQVLRDMFVNLLAASVDNRMNNAAHPAFVEIIKQLSPFDAKVIKLFCYKTTYPGISITERHHDGKLTPFLHDIFDLLSNASSFDKVEQLNLTMALDNLIRLGLMFKNYSIIEMDYDYDLFKKHWQYKIYEESKSNAESVLKMRKYRIELTKLGRALKKCCLDD